VFHHLFSFSTRPISSLIVAWRTRFCTVIICYYKSLQNLIPPSLTDLARLWYLVWKLTKIAYLTYRYRDSTEEMSRRTEMSSTRFLNVGKSGWETTSYISCYSYFRGGVEIINTRVIQSNASLYCYSTYIPSRQYVSATRSYHHASNIKTYP
jgi:hypothetical protein